jgi:hypothetical protein
MNCPPCTSDFHLFGPLKNDPAEKQFAASASMELLISFWLQTPHISFFFSGMPALVPQWDRYPVCSGHCCGLMCHLHSCASKHEVRHQNVCCLLSLSCTFK